MNFNFELILVWLTIITGVIPLIDYLFFAKKRKALAAADPENAEAIKPKIVEHAWSFFPILLIVLVLRSFMVDHFRVPSGSLEPTINVGDFILVNRMVYGVKLPIVNTQIIPVGKPQRGDIAVFRYPINPQIYFVKRVIGVPGDSIDYINKQLIINGEAISQQWLDKEIDESSSGNAVVDRYQEIMGDTVHDIYIRPDRKAVDFYNLEIPQGYYLMIGDNRDNSSDSRDWGFVAEEAFVGKAFRIWMSWDSLRNRVRFERVGKAIK